MGIHGILTLFFVYKNLLSNVTANILIGIIFLCNREKAIIMYIFIYTWDSDTSFLLSIFLKMNVKEVKRLVL